MEHVFIVSMATRRFHLKSNIDYPSLHVIALLVGGLGLIPGFADILAEASQASCGLGN